MNLNVYQYRWMSSVSFSGTGPTRRLRSASTRSKQLVRATAAYGNAELFAAAYTGTTEGALSRELEVRTTKDTEITKEDKPASTRKRQRLAVGDGITLVPRAQPRIKRIEQMKT
jgi:hypothetical protein